MIAEEGNTTNRQLNATISVNNTQNVGIPARGNEQSLQQNPTNNQPTASVD